MDEEKWKHKYDQVLIKEFKSFFRLSGDVCNKDLIEIYQSSKGIDKSPIWEAISNTLKTDSTKAYKYFTNTWSRINVDKWPKNIKLHYKEILLDKIERSYKPFQDIPTQRKQIIAEFLEENQVKEKHRQYHFDSIYFYFYNIITAQITKLQAEAENGPNYKKLVAKQMNPHAQEYHEQIRTSKSKRHQLQDICLYDPVNGTNYDESSKFQQKQKQYTACQLLEKQQELLRQSLDYNSRNQENLETLSLEEILSNLCQDNGSNQQTNQNLERNLIDNHILSRFQSQQISSGQELSSDVLNEQQILNSNIESQDKFSLQQIISIVNQQQNNDNLQSNNFENQYHKEDLLSSLIKIESNLNMNNYDDIQSVQNNVIEQEEPNIDQLINYLFDQPKISIDTLTEQLVNQHVDPNLLNQPFEDNI